MVTLSPTLGMAPEPSLRTVLVTPMIAVVREKRRGVVVERAVIVEKSVVRSFGKEEIMGSFLGRKGGIDQLYGSAGAVQVQLRSSVTGTSLVVWSGLVMS